MLRRRMLYGKNLKFNQLLDNGNFASTSGWSAWSISFEVADNTCYCTATGTSQNAFLQHYVSTIVYNHKYLCVATVKPSKNALVGFGNANNLNSISTIANQWQNIGVFLNVTGGQSYLYPYMNRNGNVVGDTCEFKNIMVIDLTYMYGEGNEPTNFEIIKADCANIGHPLTEWQPYTPRT